MNNSSALRLFAIAMPLIALGSDPVFAQEPISRSAPTVEDARTFKFYGALEGHAIRDFGQSGPSDLFTDPAFQPLDNANGPKGRTRYTGETSRLGLDASTSVNGAPLAAKVEIDFYGYSADKRNKPRLRQAYVEHKGWLVGKTWSTFMDVDNLPETVDFNGPTGAPFSRRFMLRYAWGDADKGYKWSLALEQSTDQFDGGSSKVRAPIVVARVDKAFTNGAYNVRLMTHEKRSLTDSKRGYGLGVGGRYKLTERDTLMAQYTRVDGDIDMLYGSNGYAIDSGTGALSFDKNQGIVLGYARVFSEQFRSNVALGFNRGQTAQAIDNRSLRQVFANLIYTPVKGLDLGMELIYGQRRNFTGDAGTLRRLDLMARYSF
jgi:DcaP outer membrane protein